MAYPDGKIVAVNERDIIVVGNAGVNRERELGEGCGRYTCATVIHVTDKTAIAATVKA